MATYKIEVFLPESIIKDVVREVNLLGACKVGDYEHVSTFYAVHGSWQPTAKATPYEGEKETVNFGTEYKLEVRCEEQFVKAVVNKIHDIHPYEEVMMNIIELQNHKFL